MPRRVRQMPKWVILRALRDYILHIILPTWVLQWLKIHSFELQLLHDTVGKVEKHGF